MNDPYYPQRQAQLIVQHSSLPMFLILTVDNIVWELIGFTLTYYLVANLKVVKKYHINVFWAMSCSLLLLGVEYYFEDAFGISYADLFLFWLIYSFMIWGFCISYFTKKIKSIM